MNTRIAAVLACLATFAGTTGAETIVLDEQVMVREANVPTPARGLSMRAVEERFGAPATRHPTVGDPPITRWDYAGFSVFFEHDKVIHAVATR
jgi:hypothetical protein